ncbi:hypothetical protein APS56_05335 [Pseudalgibacter alginicilyticus]|uniref:Acyltransferase 3 domain-containing protein n=1 Tax=Pseudalgibacter alginicilyticus TaxID=1736674 RepID=A0A0P0D3L6_9FLAO|nr:acyltransferase family protein [Pseudalgibacter alginicilyticus]ALJ04596.1 hypothetical protein APS56_05335 [Pseudalgibacter alginicilyticus]
MNKNKKINQRQFGLSFLRILATFSVIFIHVSVPLVVKFGKISTIDWHVANFFDSMSRYAVPMFFMISGGHCFCIYLLHPLMLEMFKTVSFDAFFITPILSILIVSVACFVLCFIFIYCDKKINLVI